MASRPGDKEALRDGERERKGREGGREGRNEGARERIREDEFQEVRISNSRVT